MTSSMHRAQIPQNFDRILSLKDSPALQRKLEWSYLDTDIKKLSKGIVLKSAKEQQESVVNTFRPSSRNSIASYRSKAAGRVSNGKVAGTSIPEDLDVDRAIFSPFPKSGFRTPKRIAAPSKIDFSPNSNNQSYFSSRKSLGNLEPAQSKFSVFKNSRVSLGNRSTRDQSLQGISENLDQRARYVLSRAKKYKATDTLNLKKKNDESFQKIYGLVQKNLSYKLKQRAQEEFLGKTNESVVNKSSISQYNFINNEKKFEPMNRSETVNYRKPKGFSSFIHNSRPMCSHFNPDFQKMVKQNKGSPFSRYDGMCTQLLDIASSNKFLVAPFKK